MTMSLTSLAEARELQADGFNSQPKDGTLKKAKEVMGAVVRP
jgi:hypothetical protein